MKYQRFVSALLVGASLVGQAAFAQGHGHGRNGPSGPPGRGGQHMDRGPGPGHNGPPPHARPVPPGPGRGPAAWNPPHRWAKGERVPVVYRSRQYVIEDWRSYRLSAPPRGYQWIGVGADYFLVGVATGIVLQSVFGN
ncbi:RcnB family protein [Pigmentiphaga soli]|uniref:RcnB family protein n=1 Tax=Pigmentiphaga soli TaxID=1007095 RepID=A0ABP8HQF7_9BURK